MGVGFPGAAKIGRVLPPHFLLALAATLVAACEPLPLPESALLQPQPPPKCSPTAEAGQRKQPAPAGASAKATDAADAAALSKLNYEAQCYRHAEMIARNRLGRLQDSVQDMAKAAKAAPSAPPPSAAGLPY